MTRPETILKYTKIKKLKKEGLTIKRIKALCKCSAATVKAALDYDPQDPQKLGSLTPPRPPPRTIKRSDPIKRGSFEDQSGSKDIWKEAEKKHRQKRSIPITIPNDVFFAVDQWCRIRRQRCIDHPKGAEATARSNLLMWKPYKEWLHRKDIQKRTDMMGELKGVLKEREKRLNGVK